MQKIVRVREGDPLPLDEYTSTWNVVRIVDREVDGYSVWLSVLLERDEEDTQKKQTFHDNYLNAVQRAFG